MAEFSNESVRLWFHKIKKALPRPKMKYRRTVTVEETRLKPRGEKRYVWASIDVRTGEVSTCHISWARNILNAEVFFRRDL